MEYKNKVHVPLLKDYREYETNEEIKERQNKVRKELEEIFKELFGESK